MPKRWTPEGGKRTYETRASFVMYVTDYDGVFGRYVEGGEDYGTHPYGLTTEAQIVAHCTHNALSNGVWRINALDGWADLAHDAATFSVLDVEVEGSDA